MSDAAPSVLAERALEAATRPCVVLVETDTTANLRWAANTLTTNGLSTGQTVTVIATHEGPDGVSSGVVRRGGVTAEDIAGLVAEAEAEAAAGPPAEDAAPLVPGGAADDFAEPPAEIEVGALQSFADALGRGDRPGDRRRAGAVRLRRGVAHHGLPGVEHRPAQPLRAAIGAGRGQRQGPVAHPLGLGRRRWPAAGRGRRQRALGRGRRAARLAGPPARARRRSLRHRPAAERGRRPDDLRLLVGRGADRPRGPLGLRQARRRHPGRRDADPDAADAVERPGHDRTGVRAVRRGRRQQRARLDLRQRAGHAGLPLGRPRRPGRAADDALHRRADRAAPAPVRREPLAGDPGRCRRRARRSSASWTTGCC